MVLPSMRFTQKKKPAIAGFRLHVSFQAVCLLFSQAATTAQKYSCKLSNSALASFSKAKKCSGVDGLIIDSVLNASFIQASFPFSMLRLFAHLLDHCLIVIGVTGLYGNNNTLNTPNHLCCVIQLPCLCEVIKAR